MPQELDDIIDETVGMRCMSPQVLVQTGATTVKEQNLDSPFRQTTG